MIGIVMLCPIVAGQLCEILDLRCSCHLVADFVAGGVDFNGDRYRLNVVFIKNMSAVIHQTTHVGRIDSVLYFYNDRWAWQ